LISPAGGFQPPTSCTSRGKATSSSKVQDLRWRPRRCADRAVPPNPEQEAITAFLDIETAKLDALIAKVREAIERLKEYRTALISAAVTGKIDVRAETRILTNGAIKANLPKLK
jgi:hypothetical protein